MSDHLTFVYETLNQTAPNRLFVNGPSRATPSPASPNCHV